MGWRRRRRRRQRRRQHWSKPVRARWPAPRRRSHGAAETMTKRTRRASWTPSWSFCLDLYRTCSRSKNKTRWIKWTLDAGSSFGQAAGKREAVGAGWRGLSEVLQVRQGARGWGRIGLGIHWFGHGGGLAKLLEATHCLSKSLYSFLLLDDCVIYPFYLPQILHNLSTAT